MAARSSRRPGNKGANGAGEAPTVLVLACDAGTRRRTSQAIVPAFRAREVGPGEFDSPTLLVDAVAAIVVLEGDECEEDRSQLLRLREYSRVGGVILVAAELPEGQLEAAIQQLDASAALPLPAPAAALGLAVRRALPTTSAGTSARVQQRRAMALLGVSAALRDVLAQIKQFAPTRMPVLVLGETGSGKELVARAVHEQSDRARAPFVAVNCAAMPDSLLEAELFGSRKGAFTGAENDRIGLFEQANGGTLFLDEIGDTSPALQTKLLRAIEAQEIRALGDEQARTVDVRIVSATHRDLEAAVKEGEFRQDLLYRLNTATVHVPPLRRRRVDVPFLAQHFAEEFGDANARRIVLDEGFFEVLGQHDFPGNVRELRNAVERAIALAKPDAPVTAEHLQLEQRSGSPAPAGRGTLRERLERVEIEAIEEALEEWEGNRTRMAEALGLSRLGLRQKMRRLGLEDGPSR